MSHFSDLMSAVARELEISLEEIDDHVALELDQLLYDFYYDPETGRLLLIAMVADLGEAPSAHTQTLIFKRLLKSQFCFAETTGFTFALADNEEFIALQALVDIAPLDEHAFVGLFEKFVQTARLWSHKLQADLASVAMASAEEVPPQSFDYIRG